MAPDGRRPPLAVAVFLAALLPFAATPARALRILDYNILNYPGSTAATRDPRFRRILQTIDPDLIVTEEMTSQTGVDLFRDDVLNVIEPGQWASLPFVDGNDTDAALFYKPSKLATPTQLSFYPNAANLLRLIHEYVVHPLGYTTQASEIRIFACHLKASSGSTNVAQRLAEATGWRDTMNALPAGTHILALGDFNFYSGAESGFSKLLESQTDNIGRLYDPLGLQGIPWQDNASMSIDHTQSPCLSGGGVCASGAATGGLDDRFDLILPSYPWNDGTGYELVPGTYVAVGNDGQHLNLNITDPPTIPEGAQFAQDLILCSDHLPVRVDISVPAIASVPAALDLGTAIGGASAPLAVSNAATAPADGLTYTLLPPVGFSAPAGTLELAAGGATSHTIATTPGGFGPRAGSLTLTSDDLDHPSRVVGLTANILDHAHASLDSLVEQTSELVDFGSHAAGGFETQIVAVHDFGYSATQAKLDITAMALNGGGGRFSVAQSPDTNRVAETGLRYTFAFDATGATPDSAYTATVAIDTEDEPLPGALPAASLTVTLTATVHQGALAAPAGPGLPGRTALLAPAPNPLVAESRLRLDVARRADLRLDVLDLAGRRVAELANRSFEPGRYSIAWKGTDASGGRVPAGVYFVRLHGNDLAQTVRLAVVR